VSSRRTSRGRGRRPAQPELDTRAAIFRAAAEAFSARGFDGVGVDDIARRAGVNKAMLYYHFRDKLGLYREVVRDGLRAAVERVTGVADSHASPAEKAQRFVATFIALIEARPWMPTMMLREIAEGAPHLDLETLGFMRTVFVAFGRIVDEGQASGVFRDVNPILAYMSVIAPVLLNAARERAAAQPGRAELPMFAIVSREELSRHLQRAAVRVLAKD
jgi:TetR/AcrR family transcriptional regulator